MGGGGGHVIEEKVTIYEVNRVHIILKRMVDGMGERRERRERREKREGEEGGREGGRRKGIYSIGWGEG